MDRRGFLFGLASAGIAAPLAGAAQTEMCQQVMTPAYGWASHCAVGVRVTQTPRQECQYWCWAACSDAIFGLAGYRVDQTEFVEKVLGSANVCQPANGPMIKRGIDGGWIDATGRRFNATCNIVMDLDAGISHPSPMDVVWNELNQGRALIAGSLGHAVLITAVEYMRTNYGTQTTAVVVRDPWPGSPNRRTFSTQEFYGTRFLATVRTYG